MRLKQIRSRVYRFDPHAPLRPRYVGGWYVRTDGLPEAAFRALAALLCALSLAALTAQGLHGADSLLFALAYLPCVRALFAALFMPRGNLREDDFYASVHTLRMASLLGVLLCLAAQCLPAACAMALSAVLGFSQRYLPETRKAS